MCWKSCVITEVEEEGGGGGGVWCLMENGFEEQVNGSKTGYGEHHNCEGTNKTRDVNT